MTQLGRSQVEGLAQHLASLLLRPIVGLGPPPFVLDILIAHVALGGLLRSPVGFALLGFAPDRAPLAIIH